MTKFGHGFLYYSLDKDEREYQAELLKTQKERDKERRTQEDLERESERKSLNATSRHKGENKRKGLAGKNGEC